MPIKNRELKNGEFSDQSQRDADVRAADYVARAEKSLVDPGTRPKLDYSVYRARPLKIRRPGSPYSHDPGPARLKVTRLPDTERVSNPVSSGGMRERAATVVNQFKRRSRSLKNGFDDYCGGSKGGFT